MGTLVVGLLVIAALAGGCPHDDTPKAVIYTRDGGPTKLRLAALADEDAEVAGAMSTAVEPGSAVLLLYPSDERHALPANQTGRTVDVIYASPLRTIVDFNTGVASGSAPPQSRAPWQKALVVEAGLVERLGVAIGDKVDPQNVESPLLLQ